MVQLLSLESFDNCAADDPTTSPDYHHGYEDGFAVGVETANAEAEALSAQFVQSLNAIDFTYAEARSQLLASLEPLLLQIATKILPHCVESGFVGQLADILQQAAAQDAASAVTLHIHPSQQTALKSAAQNTAAEVTIVTDPTLSEHAAWIKHGNEETLLNVDGLLDAIGETLRATQHPQDRTTANG